MVARTEKGRTWKEKEGRGGVERDGGFENFFFKLITWILIWGIIS
jgi:hypothetical protein